MITIWKLYIMHLMYQLKTYLFRREPVRSTQTMITPFRALALVFVMLAMTVDVYADDRYRGDKEVNIYNRYGDVDRSTNVTTEVETTSSAQAEALATVGDTTASVGDITFTSPDDIDLDRTVAVGRGSLYPSAPCMGVVDGGLSITGASISGGKSYVDEVCQQLEWVRMAYQVGLRDAAVYQLCNMQQAGENNPHCVPINDYHKSMAMLRTDNEAFQQSYRDQQQKIVDLLKERDDLKERLREERMKQRTSK